jgi:ribose transport system substrate-binding protein
MNTKKILFTFFTIVLILGMLAACGSKETPTEAPVAEPTEEVFNPADYTIYDVGWLKGHPVIRLMTLGFVDGCEELGYNYKLLLSDGSDVNQFVVDLEHALAEEADGVVSYIFDPAVGPAFAALGEAGIPTISAHFPQEEGAFPGLTAWVSTDPAKYAEAEAIEIGEELRRRGITSGTIAVTQGSFNTVENQVAEVFTQTMNEQYPEFTVLEPQEEGFDPPVSIAKASAIIQANPDIVAAMSTTGSGPTTWARGAEENGFEDGEIVIISNDYTRPNLDLVKEGKVYGLIGQPLYEEFREAVYVLDRIFRGQPFEYVNEMPAPIIKFEDLDYYYALNDSVEAKLGALPEEVKPIITLVQFLKGHPVHRLMQLGFQEGCEEGGGYDCRMLLADEANDADAIRLAEQAMATGVDCMVLYAVNESYRPTFAQLGEQGIPAMSPHFTSFLQEEFPGLTAVVGADVPLYARTAAEDMCEALGGEGTVAVTQGNFNTTENLVSEVFTATMNDVCPNVKVLEPQEEGFDPPLAIAKAVAILQANPDVTGALSTTGAGPTTWARAAEEMGFEDGAIVIISMDYTRQNLDLVAEGKVYGLIAQPLYEEFYEAAQLCKRALAGEELEYRYLLPSPVIHIDELEAYYGFNDRVEAGME